MLRLLRALVPKGDENHVHFNVYAIREDFAPRSPGTDGMGSLMHWHIDDEALTPRRFAAFDGELTVIARATPPCTLA